MLELTEAMTKDPMADSQTLEDFKLLLLISHYCALRAACQSQRALKEVAAKLSVSLLRHSDIIPADKSFYEAGISARDVGWLNMAFVFLNRLVLVDILLCVRNRLRVENALQSLCTSV